MSNINFYTRKDIKDSLVKTSNGYTIPLEILDDYITEVNNEYEALCNLKGAYGDDILINDISTEKDERNALMVSSCNYNFLAKAMLYLQKAKDDVYYQKEATYSKKYETSKNMYSYQTIVGDDPIPQKTTGFMSATIGRG